MAIPAPAEGLSLLRDGILMDIMLALAVHAVYKKAEPDARKLFLHLVCLVLIPIMPGFYILSHSFNHILIALAFSFTIFHVTLLSSIVAYRLSPWHPLARYPGPIIARISMIWTAYTIWTGKVHIYRKKLHDEYGPYVRIGPNEISVCDASVLNDVMGVNGLPKGPAWTGRTPINQSLVALRCRHVHSMRRKRWNRAFNTSSVKEYEPILQNRVLQLVSVLEQRIDSHKPIDLHKWFVYFSADFMGDMAFGGGFELMKDGEDKLGVWTLLGGEVCATAMRQSFAWLSPLLVQIPFGDKVSVAYHKFASERVMARKAKGAIVKDLFYHLGDEGQVEKVRPSDTEVIVEGTLAIAAGADTTSSALAGIFCNLLRHRDVYDRLRSEIDSVFEPGQVDDFEAAKLAELPYLNAVINETLRLQPAIGVHLQRAPAWGSGGKVIGGHHLPENTAITISPYVLQRDPRYFFPAPNSFWPERWLRRSGHSKEGCPCETSEPFVHNTSAFIPFSTGPANCVGKPLAMLEMRMVVALLMQRFDMRFPDDHDPSRWEEELREFFILETGELPVILSRRSPSN